MSEARAPDGTNRTAITVCVILATLMQALDTAISFGWTYHRATTLFALAAARYRRDGSLDAACKACAVPVPLRGHCSNCFSLTTVNSEI